MAAKKKSGGKGFYVATVVLCLAACAILIYVMVFHGGTVARDPLAEVPTVAPGAALEGTQLSLTEDQLEALVAAAAPEELGLEGVQVEVSSQGLDLKGTVRKDALLSQLESMDTASASMARGVISLMPEELELGAGVGVGSDGGQLSLTPRSVTLGGFTVDAALLPAVVLDPIQQALDEAVAQAGGKITGVRLEEGRLTVGIQ